MRFTLRIARALALTLGLAGLAMPAASQAAEMSPAQRKEIETVVHDYLLKNPEILQEAFAELQRRQNEAEAKSQKDALASEKTALLDAKDQTVVGNPKGDVTLVEFFDYNCPYCRHAAGDLLSLIKKDPKLRVILRDFPILGPGSGEAAAVAIAVRKQVSPDKFLKFHEKLLTSKGEIGKAQALRVAKEFGVDTAKAEKDMTSPEVQGELKEALRLGKTLGINGTPTFIVGDQILPGVMGEEQLAKIIDSTRKQSN